MLALVVLAASGCNRLTFVKPDMDRRDFTRTAPTYEVSDSGKGSRSASAAILVREGRRALFDGKLDEAGSAARSALRQDDSSSGAHSLMAMVLDRRGQPAQAGEHYRRAAELMPRGAQFNDYGIWLCGQERTQEALEAFNRALADRTYSTPSFALANAGACADRAGLNEQAGQYLRAALQADPENPGALAAMAEREFRAGNAFTARAFAQRRLAAAPADPQVLVLASQIELQLGDKEAADRYVQQLRAEFPGFPGSENGGKR
ncbi:tetratricopeptide repeat protein [Marilutibacter alkalisoli]|uniref:Type IV pilus biogenesis/stability protein PilW n=1 Tax=Marilutibacter alkalisoli TaxID=2591633 RepID=A0A514BRS5_9GAMM|nr:type IV pilus biogenesis/stability protein PilW [Lysobacter alkalisoli]QDH70081.1 type IV pilus biogenesis/stability protein PilW [Lysobacter alkalisoli]